MKGLRCVQAMYHACCVRLRDIVHEIQTWTPSWRQAGKRFMTAMIIAHEQCLTMVDIENAHDYLDCKECSRVLISRYFDQTSQSLDMLPAVCAQVLTTP